MQLAKLKASYIQNVCPYEKQAAFATLIHRQVHMQLHAHRSFQFIRASACFSPLHALQTYTYVYPEVVVYMCVFWCACVFVVSACVYVCAFV
jgi:hypothetical protein